MKNFIVYDAFGNILRTGQCQDIVFADQASLNQFVMEGTANDVTQQIVNGLVVNKPIVVPVFNLAQAKANKTNELAMSRARANLSSFTYNGHEYSATQIAQNDLNAIANYSSLFGALPASFPNAWQALDGTVIAIPDVASFKVLYSAMVAQGSANFVKLQTLLYYVSIATTQAELDLILWQ